MEEIHGAKSEKSLDAEVPRQGVSPSLHINIFSIQEDFWALVVQSFTGVWLRHRSCDWAQSPTPVSSGGGEGWGEAEISSPLITYLIIQE